MCLIIFTPNIEKAKIWKPVLKRGFERNSHGAGFAYIKDGKVVITKGFFKFKKFFQAYSEVRETATGPFLIHFRLATCGSKRHKNTQPIPVIKNEMVMVHNGVFPALSFDGGEDISDSVYLAQTIKKLGWTIPFTREQEDMLVGLCADYSKLIFLKNTGEYQFINESLGAWKNGVWYSDKGSCLIAPAPTPKSMMSYYGKSSLAKSMYSDLMKEQEKGSAFYDDDDYWSPDNGKTMKRKNAYLKSLKIKNSYFDRPEANIPGYRNYAYTYLQ